MASPFYQQCARSAPDCLKEVVQWQCDNVLALTRVITSVKQFKQMVERHKGEPFALDTETTSETTKTLAPLASKAKAMLASVEYELAQVKEAKRAYTKKNLKDAYDADEKQLLVRKVQELEAQVQFYKVEAKSTAKALKDCKDPTDALKGIVGVVQLGFNGALYLVRRDLFSRCLASFGELVEATPHRGIFIQNAKFDVKFLQTTFGIWLDSRKFFCTMIAELMLLCGAIGGSEENVGQRRRHVSLKSNTLRRFGIDVDKGFQAGVDWDAELTDGELAYAMTDVITCFHLGQFQKLLLKETGMMDAFDDQMYGLYAVCHMELTGMTVDREGLLEWKDKLESAISKTKANLNALCLSKDEVNYASHQALIAYLRRYELVQVDSTESDVLKQHADNVFIAELLKYRKYTKLLSTYVQPYVNGMRQRTDGSWAIHGEFGQCQTNTGRMNSSNPNLQNIPADGEDVDGEVFHFRNFIIPRNGWDMVGADLNQVEIRVLAELSGDPKLLNACNNNVDTHRLAAASALQIPLEQVTDKQRKKTGKPLNFGIPYGKSPRNLAIDMGVSFWKGAKFLYHYFKNHPGVDGFMKSQIKFAEEDKYIRLVSGRVRHLPHIDHEKHYIRASAERQSYNTPVQGTSADGMIKTIGNFQRELDERDLNDFIVLVISVHDEVIVESHPDYTATALDMLTRHMRNGTQAYCFTVRIEVGNEEVNWKASKLERWSQLK